MAKDEANFFDKSITKYFPGWAAKRAKARLNLVALNKYKQFMSKPDRPSSSSVTTTEEQEIDKYDRDVMIADIRRLVRENPIVAGIVNTFIANVVTWSGSTPIPLTGNKDFNTEIKNWFNEWAEAENSDAQQVNTYWNRQKIILKSAMTDGGVGDIMRPDGTLMGVEDDRIQTPLKFSSLENYSIVQGVQIEPSTGAPQRYWVGSRDRFGMFRQDAFVSYPRRNFVHVMKRDRFGMHRGISAFLPAFDWIKSLDELCEYTMFAAKMQAAFGIALIPPDSTDGYINSGGPDIANQNGDSAPGGNTAVPKFDIGKGLVIDLKKYNSKDIKMIENKQPGPRFLDFAEFIARLIGLALGLPVDLVLMQMHDGNYSSQRMAFRISYKTFMEWWVMLTQYNNRIYRWRLANAIETGRLKPPADAMEKLYACRWSPPLQEAVDPEKDIIAAVLAEAFGFTNKQVECERRGTDALENLELTMQIRNAYESAGVLLPLVTTPGVKTMQEINANIEKTRSATA